MKKLKKSDYEALAAFRYTLRQFLHFSEIAAQEAGLTPQQYQAMVVIKGFPGRDRVTIGELAERLLIRHHSCVGLVDRLVSQNLAASETADDDRRQVYVSLTPQGQQIIDQRAAHHQEELGRIGNNLTLSLENLLSSESDPLQ